jgi:rRNA maturation RNase YbeY
MQSKIYRRATLPVPISDKEILLRVSDHLAFRKMGHPALEINIVGRKKMHSLNKQFMERDCPTDVLSFPVADFPKSGDCDFIGTVALCNDIIYTQAKKLNKTFKEEFFFCLFHGIDHLIGIHHK